MGYKVKFTFMLNSYLSSLNMSCNIVKIRFLLTKKNSRYLKVGVCALASPEQIGPIIPKIPDIESGQIGRFVYGVLAGVLGDGWLTFV